MAENTLTLKVAGDSKSAQKAVQDLRGAIETQAREVVRANEQVVSSFDASYAKTSQRLAEIRKQFAASTTIAAPQSGNFDKLYDDLTTRIAVARAQIQTQAQGIGEAATETASSLGDIGAAGGAASAEVGGLTAVLGAAGVTMGAVAVAAAGIALALIQMEIAAVQLAFDFAKQAQSLQDVQTQTGLTITTLQEYGAAGQITGLKLDDLANAQEKLIERLAGTDKVSEDFRKKLVAIGVSAENLNKPSRALEQLLPKLAEAATDSNAAAVAIDLFGQNSQAASDAAKELEANNGALKQTFRELGIVTGGEAVAGGVKLERQLIILDLTATALKNKIAIELVPTVTQGLSLLVVAIDEIAPAFEVAGQAANFALIGVLALTKVVASNLDGVLSTLYGIATLDVGRIVVGAAKFSKSFEFEVTKILEAQAKLTASFETEAADAEQAAQKAAEARLRRLREIDALNEKDKKQARRKDPAAENLLRESENALRSVDEQYRTFNDQLQQRLNERILSEQDYTEKLIAGAQERLRVTGDILDQEEATIRGADFDSNKREQELLKVQRQRERIEEETVRAIEKINSDARVRERRITEQFQQEILTTLRLVNQQKIAIIDNAVDLEILAREEGERRITALLIDQIEQRIDAQQSLVSSFPDGSQQRILETERLKQLLQERTNLELDGTRRGREARQRDVESVRAYDTQLRSIYTSINQAARDFRATFADQRSNVIQENADAQRRALEAEFKQEQDIARDRIALIKAETAADAAAQEAKVAKIAEINLRIFALEEEKNARINLINRQAQLDAENADPLSTRNLAGNAVADEVNKISDSLGTFQTLFQSIRAGFRGAVQGMANDAKTPLKTIGALVGQMGINFALSGLAAISAGQGIGAALRQTAVATIGAIAQIAGVKTIENAAAGFEESGKATAAAAIGNIPGAALHAAAAKQHFTSALAWGSIAVGAAVGAGALSGGGGGAGGGGGTSLTGTRQDQNTISTEERFRLRESGPGRPVTTIILVTDRQMLVKDVETGLASSYQNDGTARKIIDNATGGRPY